MASHVRQIKSFTAVTRRFYAPDGAVECTEESEKSVDQQVNEWVQPTANVTTTSSEWATTQGNVILGMTTWRHVTTERQAGGGLVRKTVDRLIVSYMPHPQYLACEMELRSEGPMRMCKPTPTDDQRTVTPGGAMEPITTSEDI